MSKSILQPDEKECFISGSRINLDKHHIYAGSCRQLSEKHGCWVWLRHDIHMDVHSRDISIDNYLRETCQKKFEETHTREEFRKIFGRSYL